MSAITLEISAHRIGGSDQLERVFQPRYETMHVGQGATGYVQLHALHRQADQLRVIFRDWTVVRDGLMSAECQLEDVNGFPFSVPRPVLAWMLPCDVPLYSVHIGREVEQGVISLGLRSPVRRWTSVELATAEAAAEVAE